MTPAFEADLAMRRYAFIVLIGLCSCAREESRPPVYPVRGTVLFEGRPTPGARVIFHPLGGGGTLRAHGVVGEDGVFRLSTFNAHDGAPAGPYAVTVYWRKPDPRDDEDEGPNLLPARYLSPASSGLKAEVKPGDNVLEPFHLNR